MAAFRILHKNWRGIIGLLIKDFPIKASIAQSSVVLPYGRSKAKLEELDVALDPNNADKDIYLELKSTWQVGTPGETIVKAFQALAILFTCIRAATHQPRSEKRHLLDAWTTCRHNS
jgi:hypothetical protein